MIPNIIIPTKDIEVNKKSKILNVSYFSYTNNDWAFLFFKDFTKQQLMTKLIDILEELESNIKYWAEYRIFRRDNETYYIMMMNTIYLGFELIYINHHEYIDEEINFLDKKRSKVFSLKRFFDRIKKLWTD